MSRHNPKLVFCPENPERGEMTYVQAAKWLAATVGAVSQCITGRMQTLRGKHLHLVNQRLRPELTQTRGYGGGYHGQMVTCPDKTQYGTRSISAMARLTGVPAGEIFRIVNGQRSRITEMRFCRSNAAPVKQYIDEEMQRHFEYQLKPDEGTPMPRVVEDEETGVMPIRAR